MYSKEVLDEIEAYARYLQELEFDFTDGIFNVTWFCGHLFQCLASDRKRQPPFVPEMEHLLEDVIERSSGILPNDAPKLGKTPVIDWTPDLADLYPDKQATIIHVKTLLYVHDKWISELGKLLPDRATDRGPAYISWPKADWVLTNILLNRFHNQFWSMIREIDLKASKQSGFSNFEVWFYAQKEGEDLDTARNRVESRNAGFLAAMNRAKQALEADFPLEAIAIEESLISAILYHFVVAMGQDRPPELFGRLISEFRSKADAAQSYPADLIDRIDAWRHKRNEALHRFVAIRPDNIEKGQDAFLDEAREAGRAGHTLCQELVDWLRYEAAFFFKVQFELPGGTLH